MFKSYAMWAMFCFPIHNEAMCTHALTHREVEGFKSQPRLSVTSKNSRLHSDTNSVCLPLCLFQCLSTVLSLSLSLCSVINTQPSLPWRFWNTPTLRTAQPRTTESVKFEPLEKLQERFLPPEPEPGPWTLEPEPGSAFRGETPNQISSPGMWKSYPSSIFCKYATTSAG